MHERSIIKLAVSIGVATVCGATAAGQVLRPPYVPPVDPANFVGPLPQVTEPAPEQPTTILNAYVPLPTGDGSASKKNIDLLVGREVAVALESGEVFHGRLLGRGGGAIALRSRYAGEFDVPVERITALQPTDLAKGGVTAPAPAPAAAPPMFFPGVTPLATPTNQAPQGGPAATPTKTAGAAESKPAGFWAKSEYNIEAGMNGSEGNTERSSLRLGFAARWTKPDDTLTFDTRYILDTAKGKTTQDKFDLHVRNEWVQVASPWSEFAEGSVETDRFKQYDALLHAGGGFGYNLINSDKTKLIGRLGIGASQQIDGPDDRLTPELILGMELNQKINQSQSLVINAEAFPSLLDQGEYRTRLRAYYEFALTTEGKLNLRLGIEHRYDSEANSKGPGEEHNDIDYAATLNWKF